MVGWQGGRVAAVREEASLIDNAKRTSIHHSLLVPTERLARGNVPQMLQYIYAPTPPNCPISGDTKQILPLTRDSAELARAHARLIPSWGVGVGVLSLERVLCNTETVTPHGKLQIILHTEHPRCAPPPKKMIRYLYVLG